MLILITGANTSGVEREKNKSCYYLSLTFMFSLNGYKVLNLFFFNQGNQCMLQMEQAPGLDHILGKWMSLAALQSAMRHAGVNVFVNEYSEKYVTVGAKVIMLKCLYSRAMNHFY